MLTAFLLVYLTLVSGSPQGGWALFHTKAACEVAAKQATDAIVKSGIQTASVSCIETHFGQLT